MINGIQALNVQASGRFRGLLKTREIFFFSRNGLRSISVGIPVQIAAASAALLLLLWAAIATVQLAATPTDPDAQAYAARAEAEADLAAMQREVLAMQADVQVIKQVADQRLAMTEAELKRLGLDPKRFLKGERRGMGGPFEAISKVADPSFKQLFSSWKKLDTIEVGAIAIPSIEPVKGSALTSSYGVRSDPFRGRAAMHAGIDLAGPIGTSIYATADGIVGRSEWAGGYGNLVEINHGRGIATRYAHLSKALVRPGQRVKRGDLIARMGSTGRSTGSHLHYEVRVDGKAVNPIPFMQSNDYLLAVQQRAAGKVNPSRVAMGGPVERTK